MQQRGVIDRGIVFMYDQGFSVFDESALALRLFQGVMRYTRSQETMSNELSFNVLTRCFQEYLQLQQQAELAMSPLQQRMMQQCVTFAAPFIAQMTGFRLRATAKEACPPPSRANAL